MNMMGREQCVRCVTDSQQRKRNTAGKLCLEMRVS
jgi:hypothetical protein